MQAGQIAYAAFVLLALAPMFVLVAQYSSGTRPLSRPAIIAVIGVLLVAIQFQRRFKTSGPLRSVALRRLPDGADEASVATRRRAFLTGGVVLGILVAVFVVVAFRVADPAGWASQSFLGFTGTTAWIVLGIVTALVAAVVMTFLESIIGEGAAIDHRRAAEAARLKAIEDEEKRRAADEKAARLAELDATDTRLADLEERERRVADLEQREARLREAEARLAAPATDTTADDGSRQG